jgi:DNA-binding MarR family transcriptional regulator
MGSIRDEIKQKRPFSSAADEGVVTLLRTADPVRAALSTFVEPHGVTLQQYNVLRILRGAGTDGLPTLEIAARMIETSPGITRLLDRLEAKGLVRRRRCPVDRRQVLCQASEGALTLLSSLDAPMLAAAAHALGSLDARRTKQLVHLLDAVRERAPSSAEAAREERPKRTRREKKETRR